MWIFVSIAVIFILVIMLLILYRKNAGLTTENNRLKDALHTIKLPIVLSDELDTCMYVNPAAQQLFRCNESDPFSKIANSRNTANLELIAGQSDGLRTKSLIAIDKSKLENEKALLEKEIRWLISILDAINAPISVTNKNMEWTFVNKTVEQMLGVTRKDIVGKKCSQWGANICNTPNCGINCLKNGKNGTFFSQNGGRYNVFVSYLYDEKGDITGHVEVVRDVTEIYNKSVAFEEEAHWYSSILDAIPFPISVTDADMKWTFINQAVENMLKVKRKDIVGKPCSQWGAGICNTQNCGIACAKRGITQTKFSQNNMVFSVDVATLTDTKGKSTGYVEVVQDITILDTTEKMSKIMQAVSLASEEVTTEATQIADVSNRLAEGNAKQAAAVEELYASIDMISEQVQTNAKNATSAKDLSTTSRQNALKGNEEMKMMLSSMDGIKESSDNISNVINTIQSIASQTNLLALNAAVEAARAGEHGKGFAVVAEEVRNLATRSQMAVKETNALIIDSINKVNEGTKIAVSTANFLNSIVSDFENVAKTIDDIAIASQEQTSSIEQIGIGISLINDVVQTNAETSQESALTAKELAKQAESLQDLMKDY